MGQPAYKLPEEDRPDIRPDLPQLRAMEGGGESDGVPSGDLSSVPNNDQQDASSAGGNEKSPNKLNDQENSPNEPGESSDDTVGKGFSPLDTPTKFEGIKVAFKKLTGRKALIGGGAATGVAGLLVAGFMSLLPLRLLHITSNIQDKLFATSEEASNNISDKLFRQYIVTKVLPGMIKDGRCTSTHVSKSCASIGTATNPVGALYVTWRDANLEGKLYNNNGIEIRREGTKFYFRSDSLRERVFLGEYTETGTRDFNNRAYSELSRNDVRREIKTALDKETLRKKILYRFSIGNLLERKFGIKRCLLACNIRDKASDKIIAKKTAFKSYLAERILSPRSEAVGLAFECALNGFKCTDVDTEADALGDRRSPYERDLQTRLVDYRTRYGTSSLDELQAESEKISEKGFTEYVIRKVAGDAAAKVATKAIPVVGWLDFGARLVSGAQNVGPALKKMNYVMNSRDMVTMYSMMRTTADEVKVGEPDLETLGSVSDSLNANPLNDQGGAAAEASPLYGAIVGGGSPLPSFATTLFPKSYAQSEPITSLKCDDGKPRPADKPLCPEVSFNKESKIGQISDQVSSIFNNKGVNFFLGTPADIYLNTVGRVFDFATGLFSSLLGALNPVDISKIISFVQNKVFAQILVSAITGRPSGARILELMIGGADIAANEYNHYGQGAPMVTDQQVFGIRQRVLNEKNAEFAKLPLSSKLFDGHNSKSLVSQVALTMPSNSVSMTAATRTALFNPLKTLGNGLGVVFNTKRASAAPTFKTDPYGIDQYAWLPADEVFSDGINLEEYWDKNQCSDPDQVKRWGDTATVDPSTLIVQNKNGNPCLLIKTGVSNSGGKYDTSLLEKDSTTDQSLPSSSTPAPDLNVADMFKPSDTLSCTIGTDGGIQDGYNNGVKVLIRVCSFGGRSVNVRIEKNIDALMKASKAEGVPITLGSSFRTAQEQRNARDTNGCSDYTSSSSDAGCSPATAPVGYSNHQMGLAIDFKYQDQTICFPNPSSACRGNKGFDWMTKNAAKFGLENLPREAWHWSVDGT